MKTEAQLLREFILNSSFDYNSVKDWEFETIKHYICDDQKMTFKDFKKQLELKVGQVDIEMVNHPYATRHLVEHLGMDINTVMKLEFYEARQLIMKNLMKDNKTIVDELNLMANRPKCDFCGGVLDPDSPNACTELRRE